MRWRLLKLNWSYGLGELVIVIAGVLIALAIDQWNSDRLARLEEVSIIDRLIVDLRSDLERIAFARDIVSNKLASLRRVYSRLQRSDDHTNETEELLADIVAGSIFGWEQVRTNRVTFDEMLGSGKLSLIRDIDIRVRITQYYAGIENFDYRTEERETAYPNLTYSLVLRERDFEPATNLTDEELERVLDRISDSTFLDQVVAEMNFSQFLLEIYEVWESQCLSLIEATETYRRSIAS
jgi:hypothetical protein